MHALGVFVAAALLVLLAINISVRVELLGQPRSTAACAKRTRQADERSEGCAIMRTGDRAPRS